RCRRLLFRTKKRFGITGQVKVYRLPKIAWGSGALRTALKQGQNGSKAARKRRESGAHSPTNNEQLNKEQSHSQSEYIFFERSLADTETKALAKKLKENFVGSIQNHIKWPEFCEHAQKVGKPPTEDWFWNWLAHQKPYWRDKIKASPGGEDGYVL